MSQLIEDIRAHATRLLESGEVSAVLGFRKGSLPLTSRPWLARTPEEAEQLHWDSFCSLNLARYLPTLEGKVAVTARGCDSRSIIGLIQEEQLKRDALVIIGIPCQGMLDRRKLAAAAGGADLLEAVEEGDRVLLKGTDLERSVPREEALHETCAGCLHRNPVIHDVLLGEEVNERETDSYAEVAAIEAMSARERWDFFQKTLASCLRCYACRSACPLCYCSECFVDFSRPQWVGKSQDCNDVFTFHLFRAFHAAGRCVDCGACDRACPMGIPLRLLTRKVCKDAAELWDFEAGLDPDSRPALSVFSPDDPEEFIM